MTDPVTSTTGNIYGTVDTAAAKAASTKAASTNSADFGAGMGKDTFLKLLVAQLKYQNPLNPTDSDQYMAQMAQFTQVEKLADIQQSQADLLTWQRTVAGQGMIGKQVTATPSDGTGEVDGRVVGLKLTDTGPRLVLDNGLTVSVDEVTAVSDAATTGTSTSGAGASPTPAGPTSSGTPTSGSGSTSASGSTTTSGSTSGSTGSAS